MSNDCYSYTASKHWSRHLNINPCLPDAEAVSFTLNELIHTHGFNYP